VRVLDKHELAIVVHGDDSSLPALDEAFGEVAAAGRLRLVAYTPGISTTELIARARRST